MVYIVTYIQVILFPYSLQVHYYQGKNDKEGVSNCNVFDAPSFLLNDT